MTQQWEYMLLSERDLEPGLVQDRLNELGRQGWEFVAVVGYHQVDSMVLKRPRAADESGGRGWQAV